MSAPEPKPSPSTQSPRREDRPVPSEGPAKIEPTPERAAEEKDRQQSWEQKKSGAV